MKKIFTGSFLLLISVSLIAQHDEQKVFQSHHTLGVFIGHSHVTEGIGSDGKKKWLALPSWAVNYNFNFSPKWSIGLHNDIVTENFVVEEHSHETIERGHPIASAVVTSFKPGKHVSFLLGAGGEFARDDNLFLIRGGVEYGYHINHKWELNAVLLSDFKVNAYNSFEIGFGISRIF